MMPKISVVIQTYNAEKFLKAVLDSVADFDEVIVADMESTDTTQEIAQRSGARLIVFPKKDYNICEPYRQKAIEAASNSWVLVVDADELVTPELREFLYAAIEKDSTPRGYKIPRKNFFMGQWMRSSYPDYVLRFLPRKGTTWAPHIHSVPEINGPVVEIPRCHTELALIHLADESYRDSITKMNKYTDTELERRRKSYAPWRFFIDPPFRFFKYYILKGGFREGLPGFIKAIMSAYYRFSVLAKLEEERRRSRPQQIHKYYRPPQ
ncbi:MAG: glycosyltransferase family 2 protein [Clostridium sp.]|nr:glycosyltransferase family 2 protein [Prevotella sp.]MCM1429278.1 glycosyltransferase family 2 protein [Clostridium sp.]MCM1475689.1 glycosyltransferase family 2 protein [Muribaculaceae bacterium]